MEGGCGVLGFNSRGQTDKQGYTDDCCVQSGSKVDNGYWNEASYEPSTWLELFNFFWSDYCPHIVFGSNLCLYYCLWRVLIKVRIENNRCDYDIRMRILTKVQVESKAL